MSGKWHTVSLSPHARDNREKENREAAGQGESLLTLSPLTDMVELPEGVCVYCNLPGVAPGDISLTIDAKFLHIRAESRLPAIRGKIHALEFSDITYEGKVILPAVDAERIEASCSNGLLRVMMPFPAEIKPVRIPVTTEYHDGLDLPADIMKEEP
ncbi:hypothetical protein KL86DPRO_20023 [uncultured delta proteobacterium]|uniref:SHSP domain-containing protein n=1 Tax=uncultured delta proteobacterium TaxID=34034 RepID=A0A212JTV0_9DELT|nr:hypothetical protein KL86DPRO_20023 [uncultured delta proteobacterium]